jgi:hypothetical protein
LVVIHIFGEVEGGDGALHLLQAALLDDLDVGAVALLGSIEEDL